MTEKFYYVFILIQTQKTLLSLDFIHFMAPNVCFLGGDLYYLH